ncbi:MAG: NAD(P)/FAD-dependent oxidoreductase, partial [Verrucomicrobiota bacterium]
MKSFDFEVAIIGGGSGGYAAARTAATAGLKTVVIEGGEEVGGLCILRGCMPTKALLYASEVLHAARQSEVLGLKIPQTGFDLEKIMARKNAMIKDFADYRHGQLKSGKFQFIRATAEFTDDHTLALDNGKKLTAKSFVISTGSRTASSPLPALDQVGYLTSDEAVALKKLPRSLIVLGGGAVALEFAQFFSRLEVEITVIQRGEHLARDFDFDAGEEITSVFRRDNIKVFTGTQLINASQSGKLKQISFQHEGRVKTVDAEEILFALGRSANTEKLNLEKAGVNQQKGRIVTNLEMQTSAPHIFAAGDCTGPNEIVHLAVQQGEIATHNIAHPAQPKKMDYRLLIS